MCRYIIIIFNSSDFFNSIFLLLRFYIFSFLIDNNNNIIIIERIFKEREWKLIELFFVLYFIFYVILNNNIWFSILIYKSQIVSTHTYKDIFHSFESQQQNSQVCFLLKTIIHIAVLFIHKNIRYVYNRNLLFSWEKKKAAEINILVEIVCKKKKENFVFRFNYI
jgi:hypothetical protein